MRRESACALVHVEDEVALEVPVLEQDRVAGLLQPQAIQVAQARSAWLKLTKKSRLPFEASVMRLPLCTSRLFIAGGTLPRPMLPLPAATAEAPGDAYPAFRQRRPHFPIISHRIEGNEWPAGGFEKFTALGLGGSTVATWLQQAGYRTAFLGKLMNGYEPEKHKPLPGWDEWYGVGGKLTNINYTLTRREGGRDRRAPTTPSACTSARG